MCLRSFFLSKNLAVFSIIAALFVCLFFPFFASGKERALETTYQQRPFIFFHPRFDKTKQITGYWVFNLIKDPSGKTQTVWIVACDKKRIPQYYMDGNKEIKARYFWEFDEEGKPKSWLIKEVKKDASGKEVALGEVKFNQEAEIEYWLDEKGNKILPSQKTLEKKYNSSIASPLLVLGNPEFIKTVQSNLYEIAFSPAEKTAPETITPPHLKDSNLKKEVKKGSGVSKFMLGKSGYVIYITIFALFAGTVVSFIVYTFHQNK